MTEAIPVTPINFRRAETDLYFASFVRDGGWGKFNHNRMPTPIDKQTVIRMNRDTLYSVAVFDLDAAPVTVTLPDAGSRFMSMQVFTQDHYTQGVYYEPGEHTFTRDQIGTRYMGIALRTLVNADDPADLDAVARVQDQVVVTQAKSGAFEIPTWDQESQKKVRDALLILASTIGGFDHAFGTKEEVDPVMHLIGTAAGWGGNPDKEAMYINVVPKQNDGTQPYRLTVPNVPVDGFWSISVYNAEGYFEQNERNAYSANNLTATPNADGSVTIHFGGCDGSVANCIPISPGWNYVVRLYRPRAEILNGEWTFPAPEPA
jgi:hypothetical protein